MATSITETGGSSTAAESVNLEMSTISGGSRQQFSMVRLINVPDHLRKLDEQAFTPRLISIGPIHRHNPKLKTMTDCKRKFSDSFIKRANMDSLVVEDEIRAMEDKIRSCYAESIVSRSTISSPDFVTMIRVDGLFILEYFLRESNRLLEENDSMIAEWMPPFLKFDLVLLENQLPFFVLEMLFRLFEQSNFPAELRLRPLSLRELAFKFFKCYNFQKITPLNSDANIGHFTDLVRWFYLGEYELKDRIFGGAKLSYSAIQLHETGVKFETGVEFDENGFYKSGKSRFLDIKFKENGVLEIPCIMFNDDKIRLIRNIIALEQSSYIGHAYITDFFVILDLLINTSKDVDLLCNKGILVNYLGKTAVSAVNSLNTNTLRDYMNPDYSHVCEKLNAFYNAPWYRWRATLKHQYWQCFSTPLRAASTSATIIILLLTAIQTVCSLWSTKWF